MRPGSGRAPSPTRRPGRGPAAGALIQAHGERATVGCAPGRWPQRPAPPARRRGSTRGSARWRPAPLGSPPRGRGPRRRAAAPAVTGASGRVHRDRRPRRLALVVEGDETRGELLRVMTVGVHHRPRHRPSRGRDARSPGRRRCERATRGSPAEAAPGRCRWRARSRPGAPPRAPGARPRARTACSPPSRRPASRRCTRRRAVPGVAPRAARMPGTSRLGSRLVYRLPGPSTMRSAERMASTASVAGLDLGGGDPDAPDAARPHDPRLARSWVPSASSAWRVSGTAATGTTCRARPARGWTAGRPPRSRPRCPSGPRSAGCRTHGRQGSSAVAGLVGLRRASTGKRYWSSSVMAGSASASAAMQLRMSPIGGMPSSVRSLPDEPPSSATVTTAVMLLRELLEARAGASRGRCRRRWPRSAGPRASERFW